MEFKLTHNMDSDSFTLTMDAKGISELTYALIIAKCASDRDLENFKDEPEIIEQEIKTNKVFKDMLAVLRQPIADKI